MNARLVAAAAALAALALASIALGSAEKAPRRYRADLTAASVLPVPSHVPRLAGGRFVGKLTGRTLTWTLKFHTLGSKATAADIDLGLPGQVGPVVIPLCAPCTSPATGKTVLTLTEIAEMTAKKLYVEVHTAKHPGGELRGQAYKR